MPLLRDLDSYFARWLERKGAFRSDEMPYYLFCRILHTNFLNSVSLFLRHHTAEALTCTRVGVDATFNAVMIHTGRLTEEEYVTGSRKVEALPRTIRNEDRAGKPVPEGSIKLLNIRSSLSYFKLPRRPR
jgi:hypothetical protein